MTTYQDLQSIIVKDNIRETVNFVLSAINDHKQSAEYKIALEAEEYNAQRNPTIRKYQKLLYTITGSAIPDNFSANYKITSNFFHFFIVQEVQYLLGNGVSWDRDETGSKLGADFDTRLQELAKNSLCGGSSFGFWNFDHLEVFKITEFVPLYDEEDGALKAGIRFWQIANNKPLRATLYEPDGYSDFIWRIGNEAEQIGTKMPYIVRYKVSQADGVRIYDGQNYPSFPIIPLYGNPEHQSELVGLKESVDCFDLIKSAYANNVDESSLIFWTIENAGGMDDYDLQKFRERIKTLHAAALTEDGAHPEAHSIETPYESHEALLNRIKSDLFRDAMALDPTEISGGAVTATQIKAAYEPLDSKCNEFEYCIQDFLKSLMSLVGIEGENPTFTRSRLVNVSEEVETILQSAEHLPQEYVTRKLLDLLGDGDMADDIIKKMNADELDREGIGG